jgi:hypothetical protein
MLGEQRMPGLGHNASEESHHSDLSRSGKLTGKGDISMATRKTPASKAKPGPSNPPQRPIGQGRKKAPPPNDVKQPHPPVKIVVYEVTAPATTMRSARGSWFIGTLAKGDHFYHHHSDPSRKDHWVWGYTKHGYGCLSGFGWVSLDDLELVKKSPPQLDDSVRRELQEPKELMSTDFTSKYAHPSHLPTTRSDDAEWQVTIKKGATVPFYINERDGRPLANQLHRTRPQLTSTDDGQKLKVRYLVKQNPNLMVVNLAGAGHWGFILKQGDNFTVNFK